jgi:hypothetical protein
MFKIQNISTLHPQYKMSKSKDMFLPPGLRDPSRRNIHNAMVRDKIIIDKYGYETNGEYTEIRVQVALGGGSPLH